MLGGAIFCASAQFLFYALSAILRDSDFRHGLFSFFFSILHYEIKVIGK